MHTWLPGIALALAAMSLALMSPGPNVLAVIGTSMGAGRRHGAALALGVATGTFCWAASAAIGLSALITRYAGLVTAIKIVGGVYLIWLGVRSLRSAATAKALRTTSTRLSEGTGAYFRRGLVVQMTNPKAALAMLAITSLGMGDGAPWWVGATIVAGVTMLSAAGHVAYALAFSTAPVAAAYLKARRWIEAALGAFFCLAGLRMLTDR